MKTIVDTNIGLLGLRRRPELLNPKESRLKRELGELISDDQAVLIGAIRQEVLSGVRDAVSFERLKKALRDFSDHAVAADDYETAAAISNACRTAGLSGSPIDYLLCAVAQRHRFSIFAIDGDFERYAKVLPIKLHRVAD